MKRKIISSVFKDLGLRTPFFIPLDFYQGNQLQNTLNLSISETSCEEILIKKEEIDETTE